MRDASLIEADVNKHLAVLRSNINSDMGRALIGMLAGMEEQLLLAMAENKEEHMAKNRCSYSQVSAIRRALVNASDVAFVMPAKVYI